MIVGERTMPDGSLAPVTLAIDGDRAVLSLHNTHIGELPIEAIDVVMRRYGKPLDPSVAVPEGGLALGEVGRLVHIRFLARYDVIARDWLVLVRPNEEPLAELAVSVVAALEHLASATAHRNES